MATTSFNPDLSCLSFLHQLAIYEWGLVAWGAQLLITSTQRLSRYQQARFQKFAVVVKQDKAITFWEQKAPHRS